MKMARADFLGQLLVVEPAIFLTQRVELLGEGHQRRLASRGGDGGKQHAGQHRRHRQAAAHMADRSGPHGDTIGAGVAQLSGG